MFYRDVINLITISRTRNENGYPEDTEAQTQIFANVKSVRQSEFYDALRAGINPTIVFEVFAPDYSGQKYIEYDGARYKVERCYVNGSETAELTCSEAKNYDSE